MLFYFIAIKLWACTQKWQHWILWLNRKDKSHKRYSFQVIRRNLQVDLENWPMMSRPANADCDSVDLKSFLAFHQAGAMTVASQHLSRKDFCSSVKQFSFTVFCILKAVWENQPPAVRRFAGCPEAPVQMQFLGVTVAQRFVSGNVRKWLAVTPDFVLQLLRQGWRAWSLDEELFC